MELVVSECLSALLPHYAQLKKTIAPSWCASQGLELPQRARFSPFWTLDEFTRAVGHAAASRSFAVTFSHREGIAAIFIDGCRLKIPPLWHAIFVSAAVLTVDPLPASLRELRFRRDFGLNLEDQKKALLSRICEALDLADYKQVAMATMKKSSDKRPEPLSAFWTRVGERAGVLRRRQGGPRTHLSKSELRELFEHGANVVEQIMSWSSDAFREHVKRTRNVLDAPIPPGWKVLGAPEQWRPRLERHSDLAALRLQYPILRWGEIKDIRAKCIDARRGRWRLPVKRATKELIASRLETLKAQFLENLLYR
jgi:hypothetical protein